MKTLSDAAVYYRERFAPSFARLPGADLPWLRARRETAASLLAEQGFPTQKHEAWRYTNVTPIFEQLFDPDSGPVEALQMEDIEHLLLDDPEVPRLVFVNGHLDMRFCSVTGLPGGVVVGSLTRMLERDPGVLEPYLDREESAWRAFEALNTAYSADGAFIQIPRGVELLQPLDILHISLELERPVAVQPRSLILLGEGSSAEVCERFLSTGHSRYFTNARTQVHVGENARLLHHRMQLESDKAFHIAMVDVALEAGGRYENHNLALGARLGRTDINVTHRGRDARCDINGLFLAHDGQLLDFHTNVEHEVPQCSTQERFKGVVTGRGRGVFDGRFHVHPGAQGTSAHMSSDNLLLSRQAEVDTKPQLEIYADDVKCSHGATVGQLDPVALFYLRSRGISEAQARRLLTEGFLIDLLDAVSAGSAGRWMRATLLQRLEAMHV
jgi:Fe-S cluster assembly protein SufD